MTAGVALTMQPVFFGIDLYGTAVESALVTLSAFTNGGCTVFGSGSVANRAVSTNSGGYATFASVSYNRFRRYS